MHKILIAVMMLLSLFPVSQPKPKIDITEIETNGQTYRLPIVMYHAVNKKNSGMYSLLPSQLEKDLIYIKENGFTTILVKDLLDFQERGRPLPAKPIMLTFDDAALSLYLFGWPLLKQYNMKFIIAPVGYFTDENYDESGNIISNMRSHMNWEQLKECYDSGLAEIQNHSYDMHRQKGRKGMRRNKGESYESYRELIAADAGRMKGRIRERTGFQCTAVAYPFGAFTNCLPEILKEEGYKAAFICYEKINYINRTSDLFNLCRYNRSGGASTQSFFEKKMKLNY